MINVLDRLAEPRNIRRLLAVFVALTVAALILAVVAVVREFRTAGKVKLVTERVTRVEQPTPPTVEQTRRALDRAISSLTIPQRRRLLDRLLGAATLKQLKRIRTRAKVVTRKRTRAMRERRAAPPKPSRPSITHDGGRAAPRAPSVRPPAPPTPPPPPAVLPTPPLVPPLPTPAQGHGKAKGRTKNRNPHVEGETPDGSPVTRPASLLPRRPTHPSRPDRRSARRGRSDRP